MWGNYLALGFRSLMKNGTYAFINIFGLALGLAACLLLLLYVRYETTYDSWLPDADRIYQVQSVHTDPETGSVSVQQESHGVVAGALAKDFPQIEIAVRADGERPVFLRDGEPVFADMIAVDPTFFQLVSVPFVRGNRATALAGANSLVMSRSEAIKQFKTDDVLGRTVTRIRRGEKIELRVTGVFEDLPRHSHVKFGLVTRIDPKDAADCSWGCINGSVYVKLKPGASPDQIHRAMPAWEKRNIPAREVGGALISEGDAFNWKLVNVRDVHLSGAGGGDPDRPNNDRTTVATFLIVALLILGVAIANYVNLATARAGQRAREVALRKLAGAVRAQLVAQFLLESLLVTGIAMLIALAAAEITAPYLAAFLGADLRIDYSLDGVAPLVLGLWAGVGLLGGLYPAFFLTRFMPGAILRSNQSAAEPPGTGRIRSALVLAQFAVSIGLIACTLIIYAQVTFAQTTQSGFRREGLMIVGNLDRKQVAMQTDTLIAQAARLPGVVSAAGTTIFPASDQTLNTPVRVAGRAKPITLGFYSVSPEFFDTAGVRLIAGRRLLRGREQDNIRLPFGTPEEIMASAKRLTQRGGNIVLNRLAARQLGFSDPQAAIGKTVRVAAFSDEAGLMSATIVGVVEDSRYRSLREPVEPIIYYDGGYYSRLAVYFQSADPAAVRADLQQLWKRLTPDVPFEADFADAELAELYRLDRARGLSFAGFAGLAVAVAALGLFGLAAFTADLRTKEIGIRKVFGASVADIVRLLAWQFSKPVILANLIAWPVAWWIMRDWLNQFDARIALTPGPFVVAGLLALAIAIGTVSSHAIRVARTNPIHALRYE